MIYKGKAFQEYQERIQQNTDTKNIHNEQDDEDEFVQTYQLIAESYQNFHLENLKNGLHLLYHLTSQKQIPSQTNQVFEILHIPNILLDIIFNNANLPKQCIKDAFFSSTYLIESNINFQYFKKSFENADIIKFLVENLNSDIFSNVFHSVSLFISFLWKNTNAPPMLFDQFRLPISQFIDSFYKFVNKADSEEEIELQRLVTHLIYIFSFSIASEDDAFFFYTYIDFVVHNIKIDEDTFTNELEDKIFCDKKNPCDEIYTPDTTYIMFILKNVARFKQPLISVYNNPLIIELMNKVFSSSLIQTIRPAMATIKSFIKYDFNLTSKFDLFNFFCLIYEKDEYIVRIAAKFIYHYLEKQPFSIELGLAANVIDYFIFAFENTGYDTKVQLIKTLCLIIRVADTQFLNQIIKLKLVGILADALDFDDDKLIIDILNSLIIIWNHEPVLDEQKRNIALLVFDQADGLTKFKTLNYDNPDICSYSEIFFALYEKRLAKNEADPNNF